MKTTIDVIKARIFAKYAHGDQKYDVGFPYVHHLDSVIEILEPYDNETKIIGYLHDVIEDTDVTEMGIAEAFGDFIAKCVLFVTDEQGENRKNRKIKTNKKLSEMPVIYQKALIVKAADRLANMRVGGKLDMYIREYAAFKKAVYRKGLCDEIWSELDEIVDKNKIRKDK